MSPEPSARPIDFFFFRCTSLFFVIRHSSFVLDNPMNLQQIKFVCAVVESGFSVSEAAVACYTAQPVVSKHIKTLEDELGLKIFERRGKRFTGLTQAGEEAYAIAKRLNGDASSLKALASDMSNAKGGRIDHRYHAYAGALRVAARGDAVRRQVSWRQAQAQTGQPKQCADWVAGSEADLAIATEALSLDPLLVTLPCYRWNRCVIAPPKHPLARRKCSPSRRCRNIR